VKKNLATALGFVLNDEGGFAIRDAEPGGAVNKGVSFLVFTEWRKRNGQPPPQFDDLRDITTEEAMAIYETLYAKPIGFDDLPAGLDYAMLNAAVMEGVNGAKKLLDRSGPDPMMLLLAQAAKKMRSKSVTKFGGGWGDRLLRVANRVGEMTHDPKMV